MGLIENISQDVFAFFCTDMYVFAKIRYSVFTVQCKYSMCRCGRCGTNWKHFAKMGSGRKLRPGFCPGCYFSFKNIEGPSFVGGKNLVVLRARLFPFEEKYLINIQIHWQEWLKSSVLTLCSDEFLRTIFQTLHFAILGNRQFGAKDFVTLLLITKMISLSLFNS